MFSWRFSAGMLCCITALSYVQVVEPTQETCRGAFDVYFVLDTSSSLSEGRVNHFRDDTVKFVETLTNMFVSPLLRMSYITFAGNSRVVMPLTGDRKIIKRKLQELKEIIPDGPTYMHYGIHEATRQIKKTQDERASIIIALTDGRLALNTKTSSVREANLARSLGSTMFMVGVSRYDRKQLLEMAGGKEKFVFEATDFGKLNAIADEVLHSSCVEIVSADPNMVCVNADLYTGGALPPWVTPQPVSALCTIHSFDVRIYGRGFDRNGNLSRTKCSFWADGRRSKLKSPKEASGTFLLCESPEEFFFKEDRIITVQISLNEGISYISSNVTISAYKCAFSASHLWISLIFLLLLALAGLWWMWNVVTCKKPRKQKPNPTRPPPPPPANPVKNEPKHWPSVDASFYGGGGAGGIKPVAVRWGDKGCTEAASHLEKTKDAKEIVNTVTASDENANSVKHEEKSSLCGGLFSPIIALYAWLEKKRPRSTNACGTPEE